jgi:beta-fructofuranosidase
MLLFNFFFTHGKLDSLRVLPPPKELGTDTEGRLVLKSYYRWNQMAKKIIAQKELGEVKTTLSNPTGFSTIEPGKWLCGSKSGYEFFTFQKPSNSFIWEGEINVEGMGKLGLISDLDDETNGYFISFDTVNGLVQIRAWGHNPLDHRQNFIFNNIQAGNFQMGRSFHFRLIRHGHYIELSINGAVKLTLLDYTYSGNKLGLYTSSSVISLQNSVLKILPDPLSEYGSQEEAQKDY